MSADEKAFERINEICNRIVDVCFAFPIIKKNEDLYHKTIEDLTSLQQLRTCAHQFSVEVERKKNEMKNPDVSKLEDVKTEMYEDSTELFMNQLSLTRALQCSERVQHQQPGSHRSEEAHSYINKFMQSYNTTLKEMKQLEGEYNELVKSTCMMANENKKLLNEIIQMKKDIEERQERIDSSKSILTELASREKEALSQEPELQSQYRLSEVENDMLRGIFQSLVFQSKIHWADIESLRKFMLCSEYLPGVPDEDIDALLEADKIE